MTLQSSSQNSRREKRIARRVQSMLRGIAKTRRHSRPFRYQAAVAAYLRDPHVIEHSFGRACRHFGLRRNAPIAMASRGIKLADRPEDVCYFQKKRNSGGCRTIFQYGLHEVAKQYMILDLLMACHSRPSWQYDQKNRGRDTAIREIASLALAGCHYFCSLDIRDCFQSFDEGRIARILDLPEGVVRNLVTTDGLMVERGNRNTLSNDHRTNLQSMQLGGIPQGSITSSYVAGLLLADLNEILPNGVTIFQYADDIVCLTDNKARLDETKFALIDGLQNHRSGCLRLKRFDQGSLLDQELTFLGYKLAIEDDAVAIQLSDDNEFKLTNDWWQAVHEDRLQIDEEVSAVRRFLSRRLQGFRMASTKALSDSLIACAQDIVRQDRHASGVPRIIDAAEERALSRAAVRPNASAAQCHAK